jgi:hypothetical protein
VVSPSLRPATQALKPTLTTRTSCASDATATGRRLLGGAWDEEEDEGNDTEDADELEAALCRSSRVRTSRTSRTSRISRTSARASRAESESGRGSSGHAHAQAALTAKLGPQPSLAALQQRLQEQDGGGGGGEEGSAAAAASSSVRGRRGSMPDVPVRAGWRRGLVTSLAAVGDGLQGCLSTSGHRCNNEPPLSLRLARAAPCRTINMPCQPPFNAPAR